MSLGKYDAADNVSLEKIFLDVEEQHIHTFGCAPKLFRWVGSALEMENAGALKGGGARDRGKSNIRGRSADQLAGGSHVRGGRVEPVAGTSAAAAGAERPAGDRRRSGSAPRPSRGYSGGGEQHGDAGGGARGVNGDVVGGAGAMGGGAPAFGRGEGAGRRRPPPGGARLANGANGDGTGAGGGMDGLEVGGLSVSAVGKARHPQRGGSGGRNSDESDRAELPAMPDFGTSELNELAASIQRDIYLDNPNVPWDSVAGLNEAKKLLKEAVVMPIKYPEFFTGLLAPWRGILLYGPPGTGKTMLAKAVATECNTTFFNISASTVVSKWRGDSEKLIRVLFELARHFAPSTVFLDEIDALMSARGGGGGGEHEASRRMKTELLIQMDGLAKGDQMVFLLAATNLPWELDLAMLRRLEKRILVDLPNEEARSTIIRKLLEPHKVDDEVSLRDVAIKTEGYSGSDVMLLCKEMAMRPLRRLMAQLECGETNLIDDPTAESAALSESAKQTRRATARFRTQLSFCFHNSLGLAPLCQGPLLEYGNALVPGRRERGPAAVGAITAEDVTTAMTVTKPSAVLHLKRYVSWSEQYGQTG